MTRFLKALASLSVAAFAADAQSVPQIRISPPDARLPEGFTYVRSVRELADGRVLIADAKEMRLVAADLRNGSVTPVSQRGEGPQEFRCIGELWPLGGDSTIMADANCADSWLLLHGARALGKWTSNNSELLKSVRSGPSAVTVVDGFDRMGNVVVTKRLVRSLTVRCPPFDSVPTIRMSRTGATADTLTLGIWLRPGYHGSSCTGATARRGGGGGGGGVAGALPPGAVVGIGVPENSAALLYPDGAAVVAYFNPYRVAWCLPGARTCTVGPVIEERPPFTEPDKRVFLESREAWFRRPITDPARFTNWPPTIPPFVSRAGLFRNLFAIPDGRLLIERVPTAGRPGHNYDIIDRRGSLTGTISLPAEQRIVGFGPTSLYIAVLDANDVERVQRHVWP